MGVGLPSARIFVDRYSLDQQPNDPRLCQQGKEDLARKVEGAIDLGARAIWRTTIKL
jgi:hypothetical protein